MELVSFANAAVEMVAGTLSDANFTVGFAGATNEESEHKERIEAQVAIKFSFGNIDHEHTLPVGWSNDDGLGILNHDGELLKLTPASVFKDMYISLALVGLSDEFLQ